MHKRCSTTITYATRHLLVEFAVIQPDRAAGILCHSSEDHTLHDPATGARLPDLERHMTAFDWERICNLIDGSFDFDAAMHAGRKV